MGQAQVCPAYEPGLPTLLFLFLGDKALCTHVCTLNTSHLHSRKEGSHGWANGEARVWRAWRAWRARGRAARTSVPTCSPSSIQGYKCTSNHVTPTDPQSLAAPSKTPNKGSAKEDAVMCTFTPNMLQGVKGLKIICQLECV